MNNKITWILLFLALIGSTLVLFTFVPRILPGIFFSHESEYQQFSIQSDRPINRGVSFMMKEVSARLEASELYSDSYNFSVFLCYGPEKYARFATEMGLLPDSQGMTIEPFGYVFVNLHEIGEVGRKYGDRYPYSLLSGSAVHILAHELTHVLITQQAGMFSSHEIPKWKREGYAEYVASKYPKSQDTTYSFKKRARDYFTGEFNEIPSRRRHYIKKELLVEYLLDNRKMSYDQLISTDVKQKQILSELKRWVNPDSSTATVIKSLGEANPILKEPTPDNDRQI